MTGKPHPSDWRNAPASTKRLALLALLGVIGGLLLETHFSGAVARAVSPTLMARNASGETLLTNGRSLFQVDGKQTTVSRLSIEDLGLHGPVLSVSSDGRDWYLGDDATGMLHRCDLRSRHCTAALQARDGNRIFRRAHGVAFAGGHIFITDAEAHRILAFTDDGRSLASTRSGPLPLCFPNGILAENDDVYVADTNNFRIARFGATQLERSVTVLHTNAGAPIESANCNPRSAALLKRGDPFLNRALETANTSARDARAPARPDRVWPTRMLHTSTGEWWLVQMDHQMRDGDVVRYDAAGQPLARIDLPPEADPIALIEADGEVLITDAGLARVHRVSLQGEVVGAWGPPDFQQMLADIDADRDLQMILQRSSFGAIGAGILAGALVVLFELRRQRKEKWSTVGALAPVSAPPVTLGHQWVWIAPNADFLVRSKRIIWLLAGCSLTFVGLLLYLLARDLDVATPLGRIRATIISVTLLAVLLAVVIGARNVGRLPCRRLGVSRESVSYDNGSGTIVQSRWEDIRVGRQNLLIGRELVQIIDPQRRYLYPKADMESQLLSRLPATAFMREPRLLLEALRRGNVALWLTTTMLAFYAALVLLRWSHPELMRQAGAHLLDLFR
jgi:hypothetical protein